PDALSVAGTRRVRRAPVNSGSVLAVSPTHALFGAPCGRRHGARRARSGVPRMLMLKEEHVQLRHMVRRFAEDVVAPRARELDETETFPHEAVKQMAELGLLGLPYPEKYGGAGMDTLSYAIAVEEVARVCASTAIT